MQTNDDVIVRDRDGFRRFGWLEYLQFFLLSPRNAIVVGDKKIVRKYRVIIDAFAGDPQKIGKNEGSYALAYDAFETELLKLRQAA